MEDNRPEKIKQEQSKPEESKPEGLSSRSTEEYKPRRQSSFLFVKRASVRYDDDDEGNASFIFFITIIRILQSNHKNLTIQS